MFARTHASQAPQMAQRTPTKMISPIQHGTDTMTQSPAPRESLLLNAAQQLFRAEPGASSVSPQLQDHLVDSQLPAEPTVPTASIEGSITAPPPQAPPPAVASPGATTPATIQAPVDAEVVANIAQTKPETPAKPSAKPSATPNGASANTKATAKPTTTTSSTT